MRAVLFTPIFLNSNSASTNQLNLGLSFFVPLPCLPASSIQQSCRHPFLQYPKPCQSTYFGYSNNTRIFKFINKFPFQEPFSCFFFILLTLHLGMTLVNNQVEAQFLMYVYFYSLHVSGSHVPIIRRIILSKRHQVYVTLCRWPSGMQEHMSDINLVSHWYNNSPDDGYMTARNI